MDTACQVMLSSKWLKKHPSAAKCSGAPSWADMEEGDTEQSGEGELYPEQVCGCYLEKTSPI